MNRRPEIRAIAWVLFAGALLVAGAAGAECPGGNAVDELSSNLADFPTGIAFSQIAASGAVTKRGGAALYVYLSNTDLSVSKMSSSMVSPIKDPSQGVLILKLSNAQDQVVPGDYSPSNGYGEPFFASAELRRMKADGKASDLVFNLDGGTIHLEELGDGNACGAFELQGYKDTKISGTFNVAVE